MGAALETDAAEIFRGYIQKHFYVPVRLTVSDSSACILSVKKSFFSLHVSVNRAFLHSPEDVKASVIRFLKKPLRGDRKAIRDFFLSNNTPAAFRSPGIFPRGSFFDLRDIFDEVNREYFSGRIDSLISFGRRPSRRRIARRISLGHYDWRRNIISISRRLDRSDVPRVFVKFVVYHEMLHAAERQKFLAAGRKTCHCREFRAKERAFREYEYIEGIQKEIMQKLC